MRWWLNFQEDGAWAYYWSVVWAGCWKGHRMVEQHSYEENYLSESWLECKRCGEFGGYLP